MHVRMYAHTLYTGVVVPVKGQALGQPEHNSHKNLMHTTNCMVFSRNNYVARFFKPRGACAARVTVVILCLSVCLYAF